MDVNCGTRGGVLRFDDFRTIVDTQIAREESACRQAHRHAFCDTSPLTTLFDQLDQFGHADPAVEHATANRSYDHVFWCAPDFPLVQDGTRRDEAFRRRQHAWYVEELARRCIAHHPLTGDLTVRRAQVTAHLRGT